MAFPVEESGFHTMEIVLESDEEDASLLEEMETQERNCSKGKRSSIFKEGTNLILASEEPLRSGGSKEHDKQMDQRSSKGIMKISKVDIEKTCNSKQDVKQEDDDHYSPENKKNTYPYYKRLQERTSLSEKPIMISCDGYLVPVIQQDTKSQSGTTKSGKAIRLGTPLASGDLDTLEANNLQSEDPVLYFPEGFTKGHRSKSKRMQSKCSSGTTLKKDWEVLPKKRRTKNIEQVNLGDLRDNIHGETVYFQCNKCNYKLPFIPSNIIAIEDHIMSPRRFFQTRFSDKTNLIRNYEEYMKMKLQISTNEQEILVYFYSCVTCTNCMAEIPLDLEHFEILMFHYSKCCKTFLKEPYLECCFCESILHRDSLKKHFKKESKDFCPSCEQITLQLMSGVCHIYAEKHKPLCVICNEMHWAFYGQRSHQKPMCESCRETVCGHLTSKLKKRDFAKCALCDKKCSENFVTHWTSDMKLIFIGEKCLTGLRHPGNKIRGVIEERYGILRKILMSGFRSLYREPAEIEKPLVTQKLVIWNQNSKSELTKCKEVLDTKKVAVGKSVSKEENLYNITEQTTTALPNELDELLPFYPTCDSRCNDFTSGRTFRLLNRRISSLCLTLGENPPFHNSAAFSKLQRDHPDKSLSPTQYPEICSVNAGNKNFDPQSTKDIKHFKILPMLKLYDRTLQSRSNKLSGLKQNSPLRNSSHIESEWENSFGNCSAKHPPTSDDNVTVFKPIANVLSDVNNYFEAKKDITRKTMKHKNTFHNLQKRKCLKVLVTAKDLFHKRVKFIVKTKPIYVGNELLVNEQTDHIVIKGKCGQDSKIIKSTRAIATPQLTKITLSNELLRLE